MKRFLFAVLLSGCATGYHPRNINGGYYEGYDHNEGRLISVGFEGNAYTSWEDVQSMGWRRAKEVCQERHYTFARIVEQINHIDPSAEGHNSVSIKAICF